MSDPAIARSAATKQSSFRLNVARNSIWRRHAAAISASTLLDKPSIENGFVMTCIPAAIFAGLIIAF